MSKRAKKNEKSENDNHDDMKQKKGHKQEGGEKVAERDVEDQDEQQDDDDIGDPFDAMMKNASRNARYTVAFIPNSQGTVDANDPMGASPDEHENDPKVRRKGKGT